MYRSFVFISFLLGFWFSASANRLNLISDESGKMVKKAVVKPVPLLSSFVLSPGDSVGITDCDVQHNSGVRRYICKTPSGGYHFYWTFRTEADPVTRRPYYRYLKPPSTWSGVVPLDNRCGRMGGIATMKDGRAVATAHVTVDTNGRNLSFVYIDSAEGAGKFKIIQLPIVPTIDSSDQPIWPNIAVDGDNTIYITGTQFTAKHGWWTVSKDLGETWSPWRDSLAGMALDSSLINWASGGGEYLTAYKNKAAIIVQPQYAPELLCYETSDKGETWKLDTIYAQPATDSVMVYSWYSGVYDESNVMHVAYVVLDTTASTFGGGGGSYGSGWRSQIRYWNNKDRKESMVVWGWWAIDPGPGSNNPTVSQANIAIDRSNGHLYCTWTQANPDDASEFGYTNLEIYGIKSSDNGLNWTYRQNLTNSKSPNAAAGACENDSWQSIAETVSEDNLDIFYMNDKNAGTADLDANSNPTTNRMLYYKKKLEPVGVKGGKIAPKSALRVTMSPNPFRDKIEIRAPRMNESKQAIRLSIFTTAGRQVKAASFKELFVWDGKDERGCRMPAGIYFLQLNAGGRNYSSQLILSK